MKKTLSLAAGAIAFAGTAQAMTTIRVEFTSNALTAFAPVAGVFHQGNPGDAGYFNGFASGVAASAGLETLAEVGNPMTYLGGAPGTANTGTNGAPTMAGVTTSFEVTVDNTNANFSYASMLLPSNDWFIGNENGNAVDVSSLLGAGLGTNLSFDVTTVWDAGTEVEDFTTSPGNPLLVGAMIPGGVPTDGAVQGGTIAALTGNDPYGAHLNQPGGFNSANFNFLGGTVGTFTLTVVPEPSTALLGFLGLLPILRRRR